MELFADTILFGSGWLAESVYSMKSPCSRKVLAVIPATVHSTYDSLGYQAWVSDWLFPLQKLFISGFECPYGIKIFKIYVTQKQYNKIMSIAAMSPYKQDENNMSTENSNSSTQMSSRKKITKLPPPYKGRSDTNLSLKSGCSKESLHSGHSFDASLSDGFDTISGKTSRSNSSNKNACVQNIDSSGQTSFEGGVNFAPITQLSRQTDLPIVRAPSEPDDTEDGTEKTTEEASHQQENVYNWSCQGKKV